MIGEHDPRRRAGATREGPVAGEPLPYDGGPQGAAQHGGRPSALRRFLGGSPAMVFVKLLFLSVIVGAAMATLGLTPGLLFWHLYEAARWLIDAGLATFHDFGRWILAGAVVVIPLWLISRFLAMGR